MTNLWVILWCASDPTRWWECNQRRVMIEEEVIEGEQSLYIILRIKRKL